MELDEATFKKLIQALMMTPMPQSFSPDCFIRFDREKAKANNSWPVGTNVLCVEGADELLRQVFAKVGITIVPNKD
jgi:hypothetical protein